MEIVAKRYPFSATAATRRSYGPTEATSVFRRDGFIDRYTGDRLIFPPVLRVISTLLPNEFPFHTNWKTSACHPAFWEVGATVDHVVPVTRGGADSMQNWVTTSMARNSAKMNWLIEELGWTLHPPGSLAQWDGMLGWFMELVEARPALKRITMIGSWFRAAKSDANAL